MIREIARDYTLITIPMTIVCIILAVLVDPVWWWPAGVLAATGTAAKVL